MRSYVTVVWSHDRMHTFFNWTDAKYTIDFFGRYGDFPLQVYCEL